MISQLTGKLIINDAHTYVAVVCGCEVYCAFLELFDTMRREGKLIIYSVDVMKNCKSIPQWSFTVSVLVINWNWTIELQ